MNSSTARPHRPTQSARSSRAAAVLAGILALFVSSWTAAALPVGVGAWLVVAQLAFAMGTIGALTIWLHPRAR